MTLRFAPGGGPGCSCGSGDFILVKGKGTPALTVESELRPPDARPKGEPYYKPGGEAKEYKGGRIDWLHRDPKWKDVKGFCGAKDVEKPVGEWNRFEITCDGDKITVVLNGTTVNAGTKSSLTKGKILFQPEGAELFFRKIELVPFKNRSAAALWSICLLLCAHHSQIWQRLLEVCHSVIRYLGVADCQDSQVLKVLEFLESNVRNLGAYKVQLPQVLEFFDCL